MSRRDGSPEMLGQELARYTDGDGYTVTITSLREQECGRVGLIRIIAPTGRAICRGYWLNVPEPDWKISEQAWSRLPVEQRAALEAKQQATAYAPLREQFWRGVKCGD